MRGTSSVEADLWAKCVGPESARFRDRQSVFFCGRIAEPVNWLGPEGVGVFAALAGVVSIPRWNLGQWELDRRETGMVSEQIECSGFFHSQSAISPWLVPVDRTTGLRFGWFPIGQFTVERGYLEERVFDRWSSVTGNWSKSCLSGHWQLASIELLRETFTGGPQTGTGGRCDHRVSIGPFLNSLPCAGNSHSLIADRRCRPLSVLAGCDTGSNSGFSSCSWKYQ